MVLSPFLFLFELNTILTKNKYVTPANKVNESKGKEEMNNVSK